MVNYLLLSVTLHFNTYIFQVKTTLDWININS